MQKKDIPFNSRPPYLNSDPARWGFQYLEDIATGYWYAQVLFTAVELNLFGHIEAACASIPDLAAKAGCKPHELTRLLAVLTRMDLIHETPAGRFNSQLARRFLVPDQPDYMGDFILYRRYMQTGWKGLTAAVVRADRLVAKYPLSADSDYATRNFHYVRAMDRLARIKAREIVKVLDPDAWHGPVIDLGGGAGALCRALVQSQKMRGRAVSGTLFDLQEVIAAARRIYPQMSQWENIKTMVGDFRHAHFAENQTYGVVVLSNFLHAYAGDTARELLLKSVTLTAPNGMLLIHDYFPDRPGQRPHKGALYDLNMMLNTFDGGCQLCSTVSGWLQAAGMTHIRVHDLESDSSIILAGRSEKIEMLVAPELRETLSLDRWPALALEIGFSKARLIPTDEIRTAAWAREKCRFGCSGFGKNHMCPPGGIDHDTMIHMLKAYRWALVVQGAPPGKTFHDQLLKIEKSAFLAGLHKALAFGAGPCPVCRRCSMDEDQVCRHPDLARPSMEGSGIDVYETARQAGIDLKPVAKPVRYIKYVGMILLR